ncbi:hypothetical protein T11_909 [Trichinella zimbabwensis]|uniref:Uncharacterized protein n=1 Tax=Trichinella zimbabwensis TaxID=268475 RepID=A0A0V1I4R2_9BILA|nr:hypothetical protein T11_909 [Trichinella zimbabwensis]
MSDYPQIRLSKGTPKIVCSDNQSSTVMQIRFITCLLVHFLSQQHKHSRYIGLMNCGYKQQHRIWP